LIVPSNEIVFGINFTKIFVKLLDLDIEISDLNRCESIIEQLKGLAEDKFKVVKIVLEPCYKQIKDGEPLMKDNKEEYKQIIKGNNNQILKIDNNLNNINNYNTVPNIMNNQIQSFQKSEQEILMEKKAEENRQKEQRLMQKRKEKELLDLMIKNHKENELFL
jgi:hypothetical protein